MLARVVAALVATAMVVGAVAWQRSREDDDGTSSRGEPQPAGSRSVCADDFLEEVCNRPTYLVEAEETTAEALVDAEGRRDADVLSWMTIGPWPQMVDVARRAASKPPIFETSRTLATTELVAVVLRKPAACTAEVTWKCLGDAVAAGARVAGPAADTGIRLLSRAAFAGGYFGDSDYASNDITDDPEAEQWLAAVDRGLEQSRGFGATSLALFLAQRVAADVFVTTEADARAEGASSSTIVTPTPLVRVPATVGTTGPFDTGGLTDVLRRSHWQVPPQPAMGLPSPGVLLALREVGG